MRLADDPLDGFVETDAVADAPQTDVDALEDVPQPDASAVEDAPPTDAGPVRRTLSAGYGHTCVLRPSGQVLCWGWNGNGQVGDGSAEFYRTMPIAVSDLADAVEVSVGYEHSCARRTTGEVLCWGYNQGDRHLIACG
jgi:alpha-tubulin suppressor-like RCC1 family protein